MNYKELTEAPKLKELLTMIDQNNDNQMNHGLKHAKNVVENIEKLGTILNIDKKTLEYLKIAGYLHDIGQITATNDHSLEGKKIVKDYLANKIDNSYYEKILSAIEHHHQKELIEDLPLFEHIVLFADKMDFTYKRLDKSYIKKHPEKEYMEQNILEVNFSVEDNIFIVTMKVTDMDSIKKIESWEYYAKIKKRITEFANKLNKEYQIRIYS